MESMLIFYIFVIKIEKLEKINKFWFSDNIVIANVYKSGSDFIIFQMKKETNS